MSNLAIEISHGFGRIWKSRSNACSRRKENDYVHRSEEKEVSSLQNADCRKYNEIASQARKDK